MAKYSSVTLKEAAIKSLENARALIGDAEYLAQKGSLARGLSLLIISREEAQKSILLTYCSVGVYNPSDALVGIEIKRALEDHDYKHESAWYVNVFGNYILESIVRNLAKTQDAQRELEENAAKTIDRLKRVASPKNKRLEHLKWRGLYVSIDSSGNITHFKDITQQDYEEFRSLAIEHHIYAVFLHNAIINAESDVLSNYRLHADQYRLLMDTRPLTLDTIQNLEDTGKLDNVMAGFGRYLVHHALIL